LAIPAVLHLLVVGAMYLIGRSQLIPATLDTNGIGISFAIDSRFYRIEASEMASHLFLRHFNEWWAFNAQPHVKLYSLSFAIFGPLLGFNILSAEPLNLALYLLVVVLVYWVARELFESNTGLLAAAVVTFWPSLLLHTTQMLRDPLFICSLLLLVLFLIIGVNRNLSLLQGVFVAVGAVIACVLLWLFRGDMWELVFLIVVLGVLMSAASQLRARRFLPGNVLAALLLLLLSLAIPRVIPTYRQLDSSLALTKGINASRTVPPPRLPGAVFGQAEATSNTGLTKLAQRLGLLRHKFIINYPLAGSNIDTDVELTGIRAIARYFPRALEIGLFSPFPNMWFIRGEQVGLLGRLLSGLETLCMYAMMGLALIALVLNRHKLSVWLVFAIVLLGCTALGYVVVNISTLYRMRYGFWILLIILGSKALRIIKDHRQSVPNLERGEPLSAQLPEVQTHLVVCLGFCCPLLSAALF